MVYEYLLKFAHDAGHTKAAAVSEQEARASLDRLENLERAKPSGAQVGRYAAVGGGAAVGATALKDLIAKGPRDVLGGPGKRLRTVAANAVAGALTSGAVPLVRSHLDQEAEKHKIRAFLKQPRTTTTVDTPKVAEQAVRQEAGWVEYTKLAAKKSDEQRRDEKHRSKLRRSATSTLGHALAGGFLSVVGQGPLDASFDSPSEILKHEGVNHSLTHKIKEQGLGIDSHPWGYSYSPTRGVTVPMRTPTKDLNSAALAHTLGQHSVQQHPILRHTHGPTARKISDTRVGLASGAISGLSDNPNVRAAGIAAPALLHIPTLMGEAGASWNAMKHLREAGASPAHLWAARRNLLRHFGVHALRAGTSAAAAGLSQAATLDLRSIGEKAPVPVTPAVPMPDAPKLAAGAPTRGGFMMASEVPAFRHPDIQRPMHHTRPQQIVEKMGSATTPAGRLSASRRVGLPKVTAPPGPAIADTVPTFGQRLPGANKTTIGKMGG